LLIFLILLLFPGRSAKQEPDGAKQPLDGAKQPPDGAKQPADAEKLRGVWEIDRMEFAGQERRPGNMRMVFDDGRCKLVDQGGNALEMFFQLDPNRKPRTIDLEYSVNNEKVIGRGIYSLEGDTLKICYSHSYPSRERLPERPSQFVTRRNTKETLFILQREKAAPGPDQGGPTK